MKVCCLLLFFVLSIHSFAQITFDKGYIVSNSGEKIFCEIKNLDWSYSPKQFRYRLNENSDIVTATIDSVKEVGIGSSLRFIRQTVDIDRSSDRVASLTENSEPEFQEETVFVKVLVEGMASLYAFEDGKLKRYFYRKDNGELIPLVFKKYLTGENKVTENAEYKKQIGRELSCGDQLLSLIAFLEYRQKELMEYFEKYNECKKAPVLLYKEDKRKGLIALNIRPGVRYSGVTVENTYAYTPRHFDFGSKVGFRIGLEGELVMPFNKNKWALIVEPGYQYFNETIPGELGETTLKYQSIEMPLGIRYYFFLNERSKIFLNTAFALDFAFGSTLSFGQMQQLKLDPSPGIIVGVGYKYNRKFSTELRYAFPRSLLSKYGTWTSDYNTFSFIVGYNLLK